MKKGLSEVEELGAFKNSLKVEKTNQWLKKPFHGRLLKDNEKLSRKKMWQEQEQEEALRLNSIKHHIEDQDVSPMCRL